MIKVYEMKGMNACKMSVEYKGVNINLSFDNGNISSKRNARLTTENRFVQDAIESMPIYGTRIILAHVVEKVEATPEVVEEEERSPRVRRQTNRGERAAKKAVANVTLLKELGLDVPQVTDLLYRLRREGFDLKFNQLDNTIY